MQHPSMYRWGTGDRRRSKCHSQRHSAIPLFQRWLRLLERLVTFAHARSALLAFPAMQVSILMNASAHSAGLLKQACIRGFRSLLSPLGGASRMRYRVCEHGCQLARPSEYDIWTTSCHPPRCSSPNLAPAAFYASQSLKGSTAYCMACHVPSCQSLTTSSPLSLTNLIFDRHEQSVPSMRISAKATAAAVRSIFSIKYTSIVCSEKISRASPAFCPLL